MRVLGFAIGVLALVGCTLTDGRLPGVDDPRRAAADASSVDPDDQTDHASLPSASEPDALTLAAECMERGDRAGAAMHLECYVCRHPDQSMFRAQLAEMLLSLGRDSLARSHFERFLADAAPANGPLRGQIINAHTRLMEIAQRADDRFGELFHRGAGLLLLAREDERLASSDSEPGFAEEMTCKALAALREAKELKPSDARTRVYLAEALARCGNHRAAGAERTAMRQALLPEQLTPSERRNCLIVDSIER
jgi:Flp pilus assembly protein TadD